MSRTWRKARSASRSRGVFPSSEPLSWIASLVERQPRLQAVTLWAAELSPELRLQLNAAAERVASVSAQLVEPLLLGARAALAHFGPTGFERWWQLGFALASHARASQASESFFTLDPATFGAGGLDAAETWCTLGQRVSERSRYLGATYFAKTLPVLAADGGSERLRAWTEASLALLDREGWQAQLIVELSFAGAPSSVLATRAPAHWYELALALAPAIEPQRLISSPPAALSALSAAEQAKLLLAIKAASHHDPSAAHHIFDELPATLTLLTPDARAALLSVLAALASETISAPSLRTHVAATTDAIFAPAPTASRVQAGAREAALSSRAAASRVSGAKNTALSAVQASSRSVDDVHDEPLSPWDEARGAMDASLMATAELGALEAWTAPRVADDVDAARDALRALAAGGAELRRVVYALSEAQLLAAFRALLPVAHASPDAAVSALLILPELFRHADAARLTRWVEQGLAIGRERAAAVKAHFALQSRSSRAALLAAASGVLLEPELGVWRKLLEMASGEPAVIRRTTTLSLRPSLERDPALGEVELPELCDFLPDREGNRAVLRFLTMQLAGRRELGTYTPHFSSRALPQLRAAPPQLEELFLVTEAIRIQYRLAEAYPGTVDETAQLATKLLDAWQADAPRTFSRLCDALLALALALAEPALAAHPPSARASTLDMVQAPPPREASSTNARLPEVARARSLRWLPAALAHDVLSMSARLRVPEATVLTSLEVAEQLALRVAHFDLEAVLQLTASAPRATTGAPPTLTMHSEASEAVHAKNELGAGELVFSQGETATRTTADPNAYGCAAALAAEASDSTEPADDETQLPLRLPTARRAQLQGIQSFVYDEWDHTIADYRVQHCRVRELPLTADSGVFFERTVCEARDLLSQVKRQFEQLRPERYRA